MPFLFGASIATELSTYLMDIKQQKKLSIIIILLGHKNTKDCWFQRPLAMYQNLSSYFVEAMGIEPCPKAFHPMRPPAQSVF